MDDSLVETIPYRGAKIKIHYDEGYESPNDWGNEDLFLVGYHSDFTVEREDIITKEEAQRIFSNDNEGDYGGEEDTEIQALRKKYHLFGLEAYIHSGISLAISYEGNFPDRRWDVSQLGLVLAEKKSWRMRKSAYKAAQGLIGTWNDYLSNNVYGFVTEDADGSMIESVWGYYGDWDTQRDGKDSYIMTEAKRGIDYWLKEKRGEHYMYLKEKIKGGVALAYRDPMPQYLLG